MVSAVQQLLCMTQIEVAVAAALALQKIVCCAHLVHGRFCNHQLLSILLLHASSSQVGVYGHTRRRDVEWESWLGQPPPSGASASWQGVLCTAAAGPGCCVPHHLQAQMLLCTTLLCSCVGYFVDIVCVTYSR
jgi:hypothetical protein